MIIFMAVLLHYAANSRDAVKATEREVKTVSQVLVQSNFLPPHPRPSEGFEGDFSLWQDDGNASASQPNCFFSGGGGSVLH